MKAKNKIKMIIKTPLLIFKGGSMRMISVLSRAIIFLCCIFFVLFFAPKSYAEYSHSPRQTGEAVLDELLMGSNRFVVRVESNGCTDKNSFKIDVKKEEGLSPKAPHYVLTIRRIKPDECKAIVDDGTLILFDMEKDLGIKSDFTYSLTNRVFSSSRVQLSEESLRSVIEKYLTFDFPEIKEIKPEPYEIFVMEHDYFTCLIPANWKLKRDKEGGEKAGIFEIKLTKPDKAKPEDGERYFFPDPFIYIGYFTKNNNQNQTYESFIMDYEKLVQKRQGSDKSRYEKPKSIRFNGKEAQEHVYEVYQAKPRGPLFTTEYWLKAKFIVVKAKDGFYVLAYKSPKEFYDNYLAVFKEVVKSFKPVD